MNPEDQLDRVGEIELKVEVAGLAVSMLADRAERVRHLAGNAADRAKKVPVQVEQSWCAQETRGDDLVGIEPKPSGQGQRTDAGDFLGRTSDQVVAKSLDNRGVDALLGQSVQQPFQPLATRGRQPIRLRKRIAGEQSPAGLDS